MGMLIFQMFTDTNCHPIPNVYGKKIKSNEILEYVTDYINNLTQQKLNDTIKKKILHKHSI